MNFLLWIEESILGIFIRESLWGYPIILSSHGVGMAIVMGVVIALNMRVLGFARGLSIQAFDGLFLVGWLGFFINLVSGLILFAGSASIYFFQGTFILKMSFILAGGILMKLVMNAVRNQSTEMTTKILSLVCLVCWVGGLITGRLMAYL